MAENVRIYGGIVPASLLSVDIPSSSQGIRIRSKTAGAETDDKVKLRHIFGPMNLSSGEEFCG